MNDKIGAFDAVLDLGDIVPPKKPAAATKKATVKRVTIVLEENDEMPPSGLFLSHNGVGYNLRAGEEASVPEYLLEVLDNASLAIPRTDGDRIIEYRARSRFPYRIIKES